MKVHLLLLMVLLIAEAGFCQTTSSTVTNTTTPKKTESLTDGKMLPEKMDSMRQVLAHAATNKERADLCFSICLYFGSRLKIDSALFYCDRIKKESEAGNYELGLAKYYIIRSYTLYYRNVQEPESINKGIDILKRYKEPSLSGFAYRVLARQFQQLENPQLSRRYYHISIDYYKAAENLAALQFDYYELGNTFSQSFEKDSVAIYYLKALELAEKLSDPRRIELVAKALADLYVSTGDLQKASQYFQYALDNHTEGVSIVARRGLISNYIDILLKMGNFSKIEPLMKEYEQLNSQLGDLFGIITFYNIKGKYYFHKKNYPEALLWLRKAFYGLYSGGRGSVEIKNNAWYLGQAEYLSEQYDSAITRFRYLVKLDNEMTLPVSFPEANLYLSQAYDLKSKKDSALYYLRAFNHLKDSMYQVKKDQTVLELTTKYETEKKEQQIALLQREKELNVFQLKANMDEIEKTKLVDAQRAQQLALVSQQSEINRLEADRKTLALDNKQKEFLKNQNELALLEKENLLQKAISNTQTQRNKFAYILIAAILLFSGLIYYRYTRTRKLSAKLATSLVELKQAQDQLIKTEKEKEAENIRVRISRDIHDEVGATLSGVALFSEIAREKMNQHREDDAQIYLQHITENSKEMVDKMSDIVWAINPENDSVDRIISKLQSYAFNLCAGKGMSFHTKIDEGIRNYFPSMQVKRNLYLFLKEAINNAVKYSEGKNILLLLHKTLDQVKAEVRDDGKGFDPLCKNEGNGLRNMKARAGSLEGSFVIHSTPGNGTTVSLAFNFHPAGGQEATI